jgi:membrane carboxypeptidase/penicillin-binding protein
MAKKNKPLNVGGFMQEVKNNQPTKNEEFPEKNKEVTVPESTQSSVVDDGGRKLDPVVQPVEEMSAQETTTSEQQSSKTLGFQNPTTQNKSNFNIIEL